MRRCSRVSIAAGHPDPGARVAGAFAAAVRGFDPTRPVLVLGHDDADGLSAATLFLRAFAAAGRPARARIVDADGLSATTPFLRAFAAAGRPARARIVGRGEDPWSPELRAELAAMEPGGLVVADLGSRAGALRPGVATVIVDHHVPSGRPEGAVVITGHGLDPLPTTSLLAFWCAAALCEPDDMLWLAAIDRVGDMADAAGFPEMEEARRRHGITALRGAVSLVNAARRSASGDAAPALGLLLKAEGPKDVTSGVHPETAVLRAAQGEVKAALAEAKRVAPTVRGGVALFRLCSPCQIHPLVAQAWRGRLKTAIVLAANSGFRPGWVHFAARTATAVDLIDFLARRRPPGADERYGSGHAQATGGALRPDDWNAFLAGLGFAPEASA